VKTRCVLITLAVILAMTALTGCDTDNNERQRLVCEVAAVNNGAPLISAYLNSGNDKIVGTDDDFFPIDSVPVLFKARALNSQMVLPENGTYSWFHITSYDLVWHPGPTAPQELTNYNVTGGLVDAIVPVDDESVVSILVADRSMKEQPWFRQLFDDFMDPNTPPSSFNAFLEITFYGHETSSEHQVAIPAGLAVNFYGAIFSN